MALDAFGVDRFKSVVSHDHKSRAERRACHVWARVTVGGRDAQCVVQNISEGGAGLSLDSIIRLSTGQRVLLSLKELGDLPCIVRWAAPPRYGVEFDGLGRQSQAVRDFYDQLTPAAT